MGRVTGQPPPTRRTIVPSAAAALAVLLVAACSQSTPASGGRPDRAASPAPSGSAAAAPAISAAPGPTNVGSFDAPHAAQVLNPSVGLIIATGVTGGRGSGTAEGSGFVFRAQ